MAVLQVQVYMKQMYVHVDQLSESLRSVVEWELYIVITLSRGNSHTLLFSIMTSPILTVAAIH